MINNVFNTIHEKTQFQIQVFNEISGESLGTGGFYLFENMEVIKPIKEFWFPVKLTSNSRKVRLIDQIGYIHFYMILQPEEIHNKRKYDEILEEYFLKAPSIKDPIFQNHIHLLEFTPDQYQFHIDFLKR